MSADAPLFGLVLTAAPARRMQRDKAAIEYHGQSQLHWTFHLLSHVCAATFVSVRPDQREEPTRAGLPQIVDRQPGIGPIAGISAALHAHPKGGMAGGRLRPALLRMSRRFAIWSSIAIRADRNRIQEQPRWPARAALRDLGTGRSRAGARVRRRG